MIFFSKMEKKKIKKIICFNFSSFLIP
jgi:hypothetical protein